MKHAGLQFTDDAVGGVVVMVVTEAVPGVEASEAEIIYHITGRTQDLKCIFGNHLKPGLSRPGGPIVRPQVCISNTKTPSL